MSFLQQIASNQEIYSKCMMLPGLILGFTFHEYAHAKVAYLLGDDTPVYEGRITLNPVKHVDLIGLLFLVILGFGWAKPVHFNPSKLKKPKRDEGLIAVAGPLTNLVLAFLFMIIITLFIIYTSKFHVSDNVALVIYDMLNMACYYNCLMCVFNMIPLPPFDGFHVLVSLLPRKISIILNANAYKISRISFLIIIAVFYFNSRLLSIPVMFVYNLISNFGRAILGIVL